MDKKQRNKAKRRLKKSIGKLIGSSVGCNATYDDKTKSWKVHLSVDFSIPEGMETVEKSPHEDAERKEVIEYMKSKRQEIECVLKESHNAVPDHDKEEDFNYTQHFPPVLKTISMMADSDGVRLKTPEELEKVKQDHPHLVDMIEHDVEVLSKGYFVYEGTEGYEDTDGFRLMKYGSLRGRYAFVIPHKEENMGGRRFCETCNTETGVVIKEKNVTRFFKKEAFDIAEKYAECMECGHEVYDEETANDTLRKLSEMYQEKNSFTS